MEEDIAFRFLKMRPFEPGCGDRFAIFPSLKSSVDVTSLAKRSSTSARWLHLDRGIFEVFLWPLAIA